MIYKRMFYSILFFLSVNSYAQKIEWNENRKLTIEDFKGKVPANQGERAATTATGIKYSYSQDNKKIEVLTYAYFDAQKSWIDKSKYTAQLLNHEQRHFDISEIYHRKLKKAINQELKKSKNPQNIIAKRFKEIYGQSVNLQSLYDRETDYGRNIEKQKEYDAKIDAMLKLELDNW